MAENPHYNEDPIASASSAVPAASSASENPVVAVAQKAKSAVQKYVARPGIESRPSVRLQRGPASASFPQSSIQMQRSHDVVPAPTSGGETSTGWRSLFRRQEEAGPRIEEKDHLPIMEGSRQDGREPVMVPRHVAEELAPHIVAHADGGGDPHAAAKEYAANADLYMAPEKEDTGGFWGGIRSLFGHGKHSNDDGFSSSIQAYNSDEYSSDMVDLLDVIDPEVSTLSTLTNVQNSLFVPSLGNVVNRRPTYTLSAEPEELRRLQKLKESLKDVSVTLKERAKSRIRTFFGRPPIARASSISSTLTISHYAVLQHGETLDGWSAEDKEMLDDMVRHSLHSRRAKLKRSLKGFGQYVRRPFGLFITVYATLITLFGAAWVLFLIGWISLGEKREYVINVVDNVLVALFAVIGDGLAPFRAVDTYHMIFIAHYYRKTWKLRRKLGLPDLIDHNDLPEQQKEDLDADADVERLAGRGRFRRRFGKKLTASNPGEYSVLTEKEQVRLEYHERKFSKSHTFYKPHETATHYAFPLRLLVTIVLLLDCHSLLQISLGACTWGIPYESRPFALTTVILCCSITCNIMGGVFISIGDRRTRKTEVLELMMRRELTSEAIEKMQKQKMKEAEDLGMIDRSTRKQAEKEMEEQENQEIKHAWKQVPFLPKKLLGKGEDTREPALPQAHRGSAQRLAQTGGQGNSKVGNDNAAASASTTNPSLVQKLGLGTKSSTQPQTPAPPPPPPPALGTRDRILRLVRRADMDLS